MRGDRTDPECYQVFFRKWLCCTDLVKGSLPQQMVTREYDRSCCRRDRPDTLHCPGNGREGIFSCRFGKETIIRNRVSQFFDLVSYEIPVDLVGYDIDLIRCRKPGGPLNGLLE